MTDAQNGSAIQTNYQIGEWLADPHRCTLVRNGTATKIGPRAMNVLMYLAERASKVVTHDELLDAFWPRSPHSTNAVHKCVAELRHAFAYDEVEVPYIETVAKRGYCLVAPVQQVATRSDAHHDHPTAERRMLRIELGDRSAVVLPQDSRKRSDTESTLLDTIRKEFIARAGQLTQLAVSWQPLASDEHASEMGADYALEVDAQSAGEKLRVSLVATPSSADLPSHHKQFEAAERDRLTLLNDVVAHSIEMLSVLLDDRHIQGMREWGTRNARAYRDALDATASHRGQNFASLARAELLFKRAIDADPNFSLVYSRLAAVYHDLGMMAKDTPTREQARQQIQVLLGAARRSSIDPDAIASIERQYRFLSLANAFDAEMFWAAEIVKNPTNPVAWRRYGDLLLGAQLLDESEAFLNRAIELADENARDWLEQDEVTLASARGEFERAVILMKRNVERFPDFTLSTFALVRVLSKLGRYPEAEMYLSRLQATDAPWAFFARLVMMALRGDIPLGSNQLRHMFEDPLANNTTRGVACFILGDVAMGIRYWREVEPGFLPLLWQFNTPQEWFWAPGVVEDPRYQDLLDELGFGRRWRAYMRAQVAELTLVTNIPVTSLIAAEDLQPSA